MSFICKPATFFLITIVIAVCINLVLQITDGTYPGISQICCTCCCISLSFIFMTGLCFYNIMIAWGITIITCIISSCSMSINAYSIINKEKK